MRAYSTVRVFLSNRQAILQIAAIIVLLFMGLTCLATYAGTAADGRHPLAWMFAALFFFALSCVAAHQKV